MLSILDSHPRISGPRLCDGVSRREMLRVGGLGLFGLGLANWNRAAGAELVAAPAAAGSFGRAKSCIVLFLMGGPPQHSTWDPKPDAVAEIRGAFGPVETKTPGVRICELLAHTAEHTGKIAILRGVSTGDNAHSSSGYAMLTGQPHQPLNVENANPGPPNDWPVLGAVVQHLRGPVGKMPTAIRLPQHIFNTDKSVWPGQDSGFLGAAADPWLLRCDLAAQAASVAQLALPAELSASRLENRRDLLAQLDGLRRAADNAEKLAAFSDLHARAFDLLYSRQARGAFDLEQEPASVRDRYGRGQFGQGVLLARRLVEAGVGLVQVNWFRGGDEPSDNPCWDSHTDEANRLKNVLAGPFDLAYAALLEDLDRSGRLDETLVVCMGEFGRSPKINPRGGREHWGNVFSVALAGGGIRGGRVYGASDKDGGYPKDGLVRPADLTATIFHCLGHDPETQIHDHLGRPMPISRGQVIQPILA